MPFVFYYCSNPAAHCRAIWLLKNFVCNSATFCRVSKTLFSRLFNKNKATFSNRKFVFFYR